MKIAEHQLKYWLDIEIRRCPGRRAHTQSRRAPLFALRMSKPSQPVDLVEMLSHLPSRAYTL